MLNSLSNVWVEKYRPQSLDEYIDGSISVSMLKSFIDTPRDLPHLLLISQAPGSGKTTAAQILMKSIDTDSIVLNSSMDRGIETIRERVNTFASTSNRNPNTPKIVFLDEADFLTAEAQNALRNLMETYFNNCRFILTGNNEHKIIEPIKSRCMQINLSNPNKDKIRERIYFILNKEQVTYNKEVVDKVIENHYPNIRNILVYLQKIYIETGNINYDISKLYNREKEIYTLLKQKAFIVARDTWYTMGMSASFLTSSLYRIMLEDTTLDEMTKKKAIMLFAKYNYQMACGAEPEIQLMGLFVELISLF